MDKGTENLIPLPKIGPLPGSVHIEWKRCGRSNCRCARGRLHGPYYARHWRDGGRQKKAYVRESDLPLVLLALASSRAARLAVSTVASSLKAVNQGPRGVLAMDMVQAEVEPMGGAAEQGADAYEERMRKRQQLQFQRLKDEARAIFGMVNGVPGVKSLAKLKELLERAGDEIGNGRFIVRYLGAERYLEVGTVAALVTLRQNLIAEIDQPSTADLMMIDTAIVAYYNFLRVQRWIGDLSLVFEQELFGAAPLNEIHGPTLGDKLRDELERLSEVMMPLQDRCHRMMIRSLERLSRSAH